jgi:simple sugar transport system substrate-binding protein
MRRALLVMMAGLLALLAAGCGSVVEKREPNLNARSPESSATTPERVRAQASNTSNSARQVRIAVVTHGQASDPFWAVVRTGINQAARQMGVSVSYSAPDTYDPKRMRALIDDAVARKPDGLVVSIPDAKALAPAIREAVRLGIPVISINSGIDSWRKLGALMHIGQPDGAAATAAGQRFAASGVRNALCVNQEVGNVALDLRCSAFAAALRKAHGRSTVVDVDLQDRAGAERKISAAVNSQHPDGVLTLGPTGAEPALAALRADGKLGHIRLATFDLSPDVIDAIRRGQMDFAVDQQPFLQGYLPIVYLAQLARYGLLPDRGKVVATGPSFVTKANASDVGRLSEAGIR